MESLKKAMRWDEETFGLEYDLDIYMIVAVDDFNMGAMENKGLNVFNSQFVLAECKTEATIAKVFVDNCIERHMNGGLDATTASMAKYWTTDLQCKIIDKCLQLHGGYGYMDEYPISRMYRDARVERIYGGSNEIMKVLIARSL